VTGLDRLRRFTNEARAASVATIPISLTVHAINDVDGAPY
jgi:hypothetical protein